MSNNIFFNKENINGNIYKNTDKNTNENINNGMKEKFESPNGFNEDSSNFFFNSSENDYGLSRSMNKKKKKNFITSMTYKDKRLIVGKTDGSVRLYNKKEGDLFGRVSYKDVFVSKYDYLNNEYTKQGILAVEKKDSIYSSLKDIYFVGNEKNIKMISVHKGNLKGMDHFSNIEGIGNTLRSDDFNPGSSTLNKPGSYTVVNEYKNVHLYLLNSLSLNHPNEYLLSSCMMNINMWNVSRLGSGGCKPIKLVDIKKDVEEGDVCAINMSKFSNRNESIFGYCKTNGELRLNDINISPRSTEVIKYTSMGDAEISSVSDFHFLDDNLIILRSLFNIEAFDIRNFKSPFYNKTLFKEMIEDENDLYVKCNMAIEHKKGDNSYASKQKGYADDSGERGFVYAGINKGRVCKISIDDIYNNYQESKEELVYKKVGRRNEIIKYSIVGDGELYFASDYKIYMKNF